MDDVSLNRIYSNFTHFNNNLSSSDRLEMLSKEWIVLLTVLYSLTTLFSIVGNVLVVIVFARGRRSRTDLRPFLINLAVADLIMAIFCMPFTFADAIFKTWLFSEPMCPIVLFMQTLSVSASVFINVGIGVDRFIVVTFPLYSKASQARIKYIIATIWIFSAVIASLVIPTATAQRDEMKIICSEVWPSTKFRSMYTIAIFVLIYLLPLLVLTIAYSFVGFILWKRTSPGNRDQLRDMLQLRSKIKVVKMLILVVLMFGICWLPLHVFTLAVTFKPELLHYKTPGDEKFFLGVYLSVHWLAMSNSFANPLIYGFTNESFRADLIALAHGWFPCCVCLKRMTPVNSSLRMTECQTLIHRHRSHNASTSSTASSKSPLRSMASFGSIGPPEKKNTWNLRNNVLRKNSNLPDVINIQSRTFSVKSGTIDDV